MTVIVSKPAVNLREELASLRNQVGYQEQPFYFDSLVTNGTFDADLTGWDDTSSGTGTVTWSGGAAVFSRTNPSNSGALEQTLSTVSGSVYVMNFTVSGDSAYVRDVNNDGVTYAAGTHQIVRVKDSGTGDSIVFSCVSNGGTSTIDNISVFEVDANNDVIYTMPAGWKPKQVFENGLLLREGEAHDYTVHKDGFKTWVKPSVTPSALTETCIIGVMA